MRALRAALVYGALFGAAPATAQDAPTQGAKGANVAVGLELTGRAPYPLESRGARLAYALTSGQDLELTYVEAKKTVLLADFRFRELVLRHKIWLDPYVHCGYGIGLRNIDVDYEVFVSGASANRDVSEHHQAITGNVHVGVEFNPFSIFVVGSDIFGVSVPLRWTANDDGFPTAAEDFEEDPKDAYVSGGFKVSYHLLRTYLAVRF